MPSYIYTALILFKKLIPSLNIHTSLHAFFIPEVILNPNLKCLLT